MKIFTEYFHSKVVSFDTFKLLKFDTFSHNDLGMPKVILEIFDEFWLNFNENKPKKPAKLPKTCIYS